MARVWAAVSRERVFKNTFAPSCEDQELRVSDIVTGMRSGVFRYRHLPPEVRDAVDREIKRMRDEAQGGDEANDWKLNMLDLGMTEKRKQTQRREPGRGTVFVACSQEKAPPAQYAMQAMTHVRIDPGMVGLDVVYTQKRIRCRAHN